MTVPTDALPARLRIGGIPIDPLPFADAVEAVAALVDAKRGGYVFTPNVDHVVLFDEDPEFRRAYEGAALSFADGTPVVWASHLLGKPIPAKVSGSDLVMPLIERAAKKKWRVFLLGAGPGVADAAKREMERVAPGVTIVGTMSPMIDLREPASARKAILDEVRKAQPDVLFVALGTPKQELFIAEACEAMVPTVLLGVGASFDFIAGTMPRAPAWVSKSGLEWLYRLAREPRRLWRRYLVRDPKFALILARSLYDRGQS